MFKGEIVEIIESEDLSNALHPYTRELLDCVFSLDETKNTKNISLYDEKALEYVENGCPYKYRCKDKMDICERKKPILKEEKAGFIACYKYK